MNIGQRIKKLRVERGFTLQQVADNFGITRSAVGSWERGSTRPDQDKLSGLARMFGTSVEHILGGSPVDRGDRLMPPPFGRSTGLPLIEFEGAHLWSKAMQEEKDAFNGVRIPCPFPHSNEAFITRVRGQSMFNPAGEKSFAEGDFIAVDPKRVPRNLSLVLVESKDATVFRRLLIESDGSKYLEALHPSWLNRIVALQPDDRIIGVVIGKWVPEDE